MSVEFGEGSSGIRAVRGRGEGRGGQRMTLALMQCRRVIDHAARTLAPHPPSLAPRHPLALPARTYTIKYSYIHMYAVLIKNIHIEN